MGLCAELLLAGSSPSRCNILYRVAACCTTSQHVVPRRNMLYRVAACCSASQHVVGTTPCRRVPQQAEPSKAVCQYYLERPLLAGGRKFDLRRHAAWQTEGRQHVAQAACDGRQLQHTTCNRQHVALAAKPRRVF